MSRRFLLLAVFACVTITGWPSVSQGADPEPHRGKPLFFRMVGRQSNAPILPKTRSAWTQDRCEQTSSTGMADEGFTEFPFCHGLMDFTFVENWAIYPRLISGAQASDSEVNTADILIDHVYEPQASVWGWSGYEFVQTFTATQTELVRITLRTACPTGRFQAALLEGGPDGRQIGPVRSFSSHASPSGGWPGSTEYATVRWEPGQAPLTPGHTYGIRISRIDGRPATPYLHATGDAYDGGMLYVDGVPRPQSDLAMWIVQETPDLRRSLIEGADLQGWIHQASSFVFIPRTPNVRLMTLTVSPVNMQPPTRHNCCMVLVQVYSDDNRLLARKRNLACGPVNAAQTSHFLFASDELPVTIGARYRVDVRLIPFHEGRHDDDADRFEAIRPLELDLNPTIYGEPTPGALPTIHNLSLNFETDSRLKFTWSAPRPAHTQIHTWGPGPSGNTHFDVPDGMTEFVIPKLWASHEYRLKLTATGPTGLVWETPVYQVRMPKTSEGIQGRTQSEENPHLIALARPEPAGTRNSNPFRYYRKVDLDNGGFEDGLSGWEVDPPGSLQAADVGLTSQSMEKRLGLETPWGNRMAGFTHIADSNRGDVYQQMILSRPIETRKGHMYVLVGSVNTSVENGAEGDTCVRLFARPADTGHPGKLDDGSTQWYWTGGKWMRFQQMWRATSERSVIGFALLRKRDLDRSSAYVDHVHVYDLGPVAMAPDTPAFHEGPPGRLVLAQERMEADDKVEAFLHAPPGYVITGLGARAHEDNVTTFWLRIQPLMPDGTLGEPQELRGGYDPDSGLEAKIELPPGYVATGFGAGIAPEWDVKRFGVWARPLLADGSLGEETLFRAGVDLEGGFEKELRLPPGRILAAAGLNCMFNDVNGIRGASRAWIRTASAAAHEPVEPASR